ncbi:uncharacterized protein BDZ99DRAFT_573630 [Mytilinidion resinicola]|uniref:MYND-type domain-containing protein n=1 Tax=Mytilinidion resinicola TaxID=574789 RepID=A0A6A6YDX8_9PEZI|nr:uncharacterized protein BDZ99DRAFT_573630 [Mytilinidion resinicola]KAF2806940.1 hypothetical protein BDZ99DRAFT_573630 [Mytilinidion resinicola]
MSETFDWSFPGLDKAHFTALANLLSLRNGGQVEEAWLPDDVLEEYYDDELKKKFLDCLAEFAANRKGGRAVVATAMKESEDSVTLWIARNEGFPELERPVYDRLGKLLGRLSGSQGLGEEAVKKELWNEMLAYHQDRIQGDSIPSLRADFKALGNSMSIGNHTTLENELLDFRQLLFDVAKTGQSTTDQYSKIATSAYELRMRKRTGEALYSSPGATSKTKKLWMDISLLARLRVTFEKFGETALAFPSFNEVTIILLPRDSTSIASPKCSLNLKQTFGILNLSLDGDTIGSVLLNKCNVKKAGKEFTIRQKQRLNTHCEVQLLLFLSRNEPSIHTILPYFGCSKYSCFACARLLKAHGKFATRGCHGRLFKSWSLPEVAELRPGQADQIGKALVQVQKDIKRELKSAIKRNVLPAKTSAIGGSSVFPSAAKHSRRESDVERWRLESEQKRVAEAFKRMTLEETQSISHMPTTTSLSEDTWLGYHQELDEELGECRHCDRTTSRKCSVCNKDFYCSELCEQKRSGYHLFTCARRPLTSADFLWRFLVRDELPTDADTEVFEDFGFSHLPSFADRSKLLGLYQGLYLLGEVTAEDLHKWRTEGTLIANIKAFYYRIPEASRGGYFPWFLKHTHILESPISGKEAAESMITTFFDQACTYLDPEDQGKKPQELKPDAKAACYIMLAEVLHMGHPNPIEENYYLHGILAGVRESGSLIKLMDSHGLKGPSFRHLESFLSVPPSGPHKSVWGLKQFLAISQPTEYPPDASIRFDYGFKNCRNFEETCTLMEIYKQLLQQADPLDLHEACLAGKLFEFAEKFHKIKEEWRRLMETMYPL